MFYNMQIANQLARKRQHLNALEKRAKKVQERFSVRTYYIDAFRLGTLGCTCRFLHNV